MSQKRPIFAFLRSRGARIECPFCGKKEWEGWDERVALDHASGSFAVNRRAQAFPLTCRNCGFVRLQAAHVLDDPRSSSRNDLQDVPPSIRVLPSDGRAAGTHDGVE